MILMLLVTSPEMKMIFQFERNADISSWKVVDDGVMGGLSKGNFVLSDDGHGVFYGDVSLENNGGFSSVRLDMKKMETAGYQKFVLRIKGDGKTYQLRAKASNWDYYSYIYNFETNGDWQTVEVPFDEMVASFRGRLLNKGPFRGEQLVELGFLVGNKKAEAFRLEIDSISIH